MSEKKTLKNYFYEFYDLELDDDIIEEITQIVAGEFIDIVDNNWTLLNRYMDEKSSLEQPYSFPEFINYLREYLKEKPIPF